MAEWAKKDEAAERVWSNCKEKIVVNLGVGEANELIEWIMEEMTLAKNVENG